MVRFVVFVRDTGIITGVFVFRFWFFSLVSSAGFFVSASLLPPSTGAAGACTAAGRLSRYLLPPIPRSVAGRGKNEERGRPTATDELTKKESTNATLEEKVVP